MRSHPSQRFSLRPAPALVASLVGGLFAWIVLVAPPRGPTIATTPRDPIDASRSAVAAQHFNHAHALTLQAGTSPAGTAAIEPPSLAQPTIDPQSVLPQPIGNPSLHVVPSAYRRPEEPPPLLTGDGASSAIDEDPTALSRVAIESPTLADDPPLDGLSATELTALAADLIGTYLPTHYDDEDDWNQTKRVFDGVDIERDGFRIETHRKWKDVRHGNWTRYSVDLVEPKKNLHIVVDNVQPLDDGRLRFRVTIDTPIAVSGRMSQWQRGVQLFSISCNADAQVRIWFQATIAALVVPDETPLSIQVAPVVEQADVELIDFEVQRISQVGGEFAEQLGKPIEAAIRKRFIEKQRDRLPERMNRAIAKRSDRLRFSPSQWISKQLERWTLPKK
jgi:hypothetical protein